MAAALLALVVIDASSAPVAGHVSSHTAWLWLRDALNAVVHWLSITGPGLGPRRSDGLPAGVGPCAPIRVRAAGHHPDHRRDMRRRRARPRRGQGGPAAGLRLPSRGCFPASSVPTGSPSVASIVDVISKTPIPQANWLGPLLGLIPWPKSSTTFQISGNLRRTGAGEHAPVCFAYEVLCTGPRGSRHLDESHGADTAEAIANASLEITGRSERRHRACTRCGRAGIALRRW